MIIRILTISRQLLADNAGKTSLSYGNFDEISVWQKKSFTQKHITYSSREFDFPNYSIQKFNAEKGLKTTPSFHCINHFEDIYYLLTKITFPKDFASQLSSIIPATWS